MCLCTECGVILRPVGRGNGLSNGAGHFQVGPQLVSEFLNVV